MAPDLYWDVRSWSMACRPNTKFRLCPAASGADRCAGRLTSTRPGSLTVGRRVTGKKFSPWVFGRAYPLAASKVTSGGIRRPATSSKNLIDRAVWLKSSHLIWCQHGRRCPLHCVCRQKVHLSPGAGWPTDGEDFPPLKKKSLKIFQVPGLIDWAVWSSKLMRFVDAVAPAPVVAGHSN